MGVVHVWCTLNLTPLYVVYIKILIFAYIQYIAYKRKSTPIYGA
jgi:hypothetical protein